MSTDHRGNPEPREGPGGPLEIIIEAHPSTLQTTGGRNVQFTRAVMVMRGKVHARL